MKTNFAKLSKIFLFVLGISLISVTAYYKLFTNTNYYKFNYFKTIIAIKLGASEKSLSSNIISTIDELLKNQESKWYPKPSSYLNKMNETLSAGNSFQADSETVEIINKLKIFYKSSNEYFNPTIGKLINYWDQKNNSELNLADYLRKMPKPLDIQTDNSNIIKSSNPHLQLNINGIITAHVLTQIRDILLQNNIRDAEVSMGNDLYIIKSDNDDINYRIVEKSTSSKKMSKLLLKIYNDEFLSTSGIFIKDLNNIVRTIVNPKNGKPADGFYGATVINKDPYKANVASIALIIAGPDNYETVAKSLRIDDYILYTYENKIIISDKMRERL